MKYTAGEIEKIKKTLEQVWDNDQRYRSSFNSEKLLKKYGENLKKLKLKYLPVIEQTVKNGNMRITTVASTNYYLLWNQKEVDERRNAVGLEPMQEVLARYGLDWEEIKRSNTI